jgi:hypothetical protein
LFPWKRGKGYPLKKARCGCCQSYSFRGGALFGWRDYETIAKVIPKEIKYMT